MIQLLAAAYLGYYLAKYGVPNFSELAPKQAGSGG